MELVRFPSRGGFSVRSIFTFVFAVILTALLWATFSSHTTHAEGGANWKGDTIIHDGRQYYPGGVAESGQSHGLDEGSTYYFAVEEVSGTTPMSRKAYVIYFAPGVDPPTAEAADYAEYDYSKDNEFSNRTNAQSIDITPKGDEGSYGSSCDIDGIGWIVCPASVFLAQAMDWIFAQVAQFVAVQPLNVNDSHTPLYTVWNTVRSVANIAFIIAFLIIIYSQITSFGVSNYGIKKLIPRLIVAAILVNVSFYVCAIAVDISNIAGYSLQNILMEIHDNTFVVAKDTWSPNATNAWSAITGVVLSGGAATYGIIGLSVATGGSITAAIYLLIPLFLGLLVTLLFVLLILAARQAIIIILIVIAPLAFVANLLPNTEKWFDKWKDLFMTMLIFFPAFALVFGGAQLAGGIIIQNASSFIMMIFGMAVQVAPLVITPLLLKLSGGLLGRIAGIVNNPRKGLVDRSKNWSNEKRDMHRNNTLVNGRKANPFRAVGRSLDAGKRNTKKATELYAQQLETNYMENNKRYATLTNQAHEAHMDREIVETRDKQRIQEDINNRTSRMHYKNARVELGKRSLEATVQATTADISEYAALDLSKKEDRARLPGISQDMADTITKLSAARQTLSIETTRAANAEGVQKVRLADAMIKDEALRQRAGGIDDQGANSALANAISTVRSAHGQSVTEAREIVKHFNLSSEMRQKLALGESVAVTRDDGTSFTFTASDVYAREAVIEDQIAVGTIDQVEAIVQRSGEGESLYEFRTTIADALAKNGLGGKSLYLGGKTIDDVGKGRIAGASAIMSIAMETIGKGKISEKDLSTIDPIAVSRLLEAAQNIQSGNIPEGTEVSAEDLQKTMVAFSEIARKTLTGHESVNVKGKALGLIEKIGQLTDPTFKAPADTSNGAPAPTTPSNTDAAPSADDQPDDGDSSDAS